MTKAIKTLKQLKGTGLPDEPPKLETEPPHRRLQRLTAEQERLTREIQEHRLAWANRNQMAAQTRQPPSTAEITGFKEYHRDLSCRLAAVNLEIGTTNREIRQHKAEVAARKAKPADVQPARLVGQSAHRHRDSRRSQAIDAAAGDLGVGILRAAHHPGHAGGYQRVRARRRPADVTTGLESDVHASAPRLRPSRAQRQDFSVRLARALVPALPDNAPGIHHHASYPRIRVGGVQTERG